MARPGVTDWWAQGRAAGVRDTARALDSTVWYRVPIPLPAAPAGRARFLAGYAAGIEDGLELGAERAAEIRARYAGVSGPEAVRLGLEIAARAGHSRTEPS